MQFIRKGRANIRIGSKTYPIFTLDKKTKSKTLTNSDGFKQRIKWENLRVDSSSFWRMGMWSAMTDSHDIKCFACGASSDDFSGCNCPEEGFTVEQYQDMIYPAKRKYIEYFLQNEYKYFLDANALSDQQVDELLFNEKGIFVLDLSNYRYDWRNREKARKELWNGHLTKYLK